MKITHDYFLTEWHKFREIMCSTAYGPEQKFDAWGGLLQVYFLCEDRDKKQEELRKSAIRVLMVEFPMRMGMEQAIKLEALFYDGRDTPPYCDCIVVDGTDILPDLTCKRCKGTGYVSDETRRAELEIEIGSKEHGDMMEGQ